MSGHPVAIKSLYDMHDGMAAQQMASFEDGLPSPGGPDAHPPGSPKPTRDYQQLQLDFLNSQKEAQYHKKISEDLQKRVDLELKMNGGDFLQDNGLVVEDSRDSEIRHLQRNITILKAQVYKNEGQEQRLKELTKEKSILEDTLNALTKQNDITERELANQKLYVKKLEQIMRQQEEALKGDKEKISRLEKGKQDLSPPSSHQLASVSLQSLSSNPSYHKELEYLHKMVDTLKATVIEQRNVFVKMGLQNRQFNSMPQTQPNRTIGTKPTRASSAPSSQSLSPPTSRIAEESSEKTPITSDIRSPILEDMVVNGQSSHHLRQREPSNDGNQIMPQFLVGIGAAAAKDRSPVSTMAKLENTPHHVLGTTMEVAGGNNLANEMEDLHLRVAGVNGSGSPRRQRPHINVAEFTYSSNSTNESQHDGANYVNVENPGMTKYLHQRGPTSDLSRDLSVGAQAQGGIIPNFGNSNSSPKIPARKTSQSEIINRRPLIEASAIPVRSQTEIIAKNVNFPGQPQQQQPIRNAVPSQQAQMIRPQYPPAVLPHSDMVLFDRAIGSQVDAPHITGPQFRVGMYPPSSQSDTSHQNTNGTNSSVNSQTGSRPQDSALCPVCNQNFGHVSMEEFQTHVFDCFDNENGPETLVVNDSPPNRLPYTSYRTCPMCPQQFDMSVSQALFEQHVHRHFGEEPFEVLVQSE